MKNNNDFCTWGSLHLSHFSLRIHPLFICIPLHHHHRHLILFSFLLKIEILQLKIATLICLFSSLPRPNSQNPSSQNQKQTHSISDLAVQNREPVKREHHFNFITETLPRSRSSLSFPILGVVVVMGRRRLWGSVDFWHGLLLSG